MAPSIALTESVSLDTPSPTAPTDDTECSICKLVNKLEAFTHRTHLLEQDLYDANLNNEFAGRQIAALTEELERVKAELERVKEDRDTLATENFYLGAHLDEITHEIDDLRARNAVLEEDAEWNLVAIDTHFDRAEKEEARANFEAHLRAIAELRAGEIISHARTILAIAATPEAFTHSPPTDAMAPAAKRVRFE